MTYFIVEAFERKKESQCKEDRLESSNKVNCNIPPSLLGGGCPGHRCMISLAAGRSRIKVSSMPLACKHHPTCSPGMILHQKPDMGLFSHVVSFTVSTDVLGQSSSQKNLLTVLTCCNPDWGGACAFGSLSSSIK